MVMGGFKSIVRSEQHDDIGGNHGLETKKEKGDGLIEWAQMKMVAGNTWFNQHSRRL